jgi:hypothetical protein
MSTAKIGVAVAGILASVFAIAKPKPAAQSSARAWGEAVNGLQVSVYEDEDAQGPDRTMQIRVEFRNSGLEDISIQTGTIYGCGRDKSYTTEVKLTLVDSRGKQHRHLPFMGDGPPYRGGACAGNLTAFVIPLAPRASFSIPLDLAKYLDLSDSKSFPSMRRFPAGTYSLRAELTNVSQSQQLQFPKPPRAGFFDTIAFTRSWGGTSMSNAIQVRFDSEFAAVFDDRPTAEEKAPASSK